jgi:hypothetical protein
MSDSLQPLYRPNRLAVIGASAKPGRIRDSRSNATDKIGEMAYIKRIHLTSASRTVLFFTDRSRTFVAR